MKKVYFFCLLLLPVLTMAQTPTDGDYRTAGSGDWATLSTWQVRSGGIWAAAASLPAATNNVYVQSAHAITITSNAFCQDFHLAANTGAGNNGSISISTGIVLQINRKIRAFYGGATAATTGSAVTGTDDGGYTGTSTTSFSTGITTTGTGKISFVYGFGSITNSGEWAGNITGWNAEFAIPVGQTGILATVVKAGSISIVSGTLSTSSDLRPDGNGSAGTGTLTVASGARLLFTGGGNIQRIGTASTTSHCASVTIDGTLEYSSSSVGVIGSTAISFNGTVIYSGNAQTLITKGSNSGGIDPIIYTNLRFNGGSSSTAKTITTPITVNSKFTFASNSTHGITGIINYGPGATLEYATTNTSARIIIPEWPAVNGPANVTLINTNANCQLSFPASTIRTITGVFTLSANDFTVGAGNILTMTNGSSIIRTSGNINLSTGTLAMGTVATDITNVTINGNLSSSAELQASPVGLVNFTINPGFSYAFTSSSASNKTINNLVLNGTITDDLLQTRTLTVKGNITGTGTSNVRKTIMSGNTISSNISGATFRHLELSDADGFALTGNPTVTEALSLTNGVLNNSTNNITLSDNALNNRGAGSFSAVPVFGPTVNLNYNDVAATTTGFELPTTTSILKNLTINNAAGVTLNAPATVNGVINLTNGIITTSSTNLLTLSNTATVVGGSNTSYVSGPMVMNTNAAATYTFPVGKSGIYRPFSVNASTTNSNSYTGEYFNTDPHVISSTYINPITGIADNEYYDIAHSAGSDPATITLTLNGAVTGGTASDFIVVSHYNSGTPGWEDAGGILAGNSTSGSITSNSLTSFSPFSFGLKPAGTLPLHFISLEAENNNGFVKLRWKTSDEIDVNKYVVEESTNGNLYVEISNVNAKNTAGINLYSFSRPAAINNNIYFRIKIVNNSGRIEYSNIILVKMVTKQITIYPNPVTNTLILSGLNSGGNIKIVNTAGQIVLQQNITANSLSVDVSALKAGIYVIQISGENNEVISKTFLKE